MAYDPHFSCSVWIDLLVDGNDACGMLYHSSRLFNRIR